MARTSCCAAAKDERVHSCLTRGFHGWFSWKFWWRGCPRCGTETRQRQSVRFELEPYDRRESPTSLVFSGSVTASLYAMHPPVSSAPALVETQTSFVPISIASAGQTSEVSKTSEVSPGPADTRAGSVSDRIPSAQTQATDASRPSADNWAAFSAVDDFFADPLALDPALGTKPHSGGSFSAGAFDDVHQHPSSNDGGSTTGGGGGFSSGSASGFFGAGSVSDGSLGSGLAGLVSSAANGTSSAPNTSVANTPALPTNILLAPSVPLTTNHSPLTNTTLTNQNSARPTNSNHGSLG